MIDNDDILIRAVPPVEFTKEMLDSMAERLGFDGVVIQYMRKDEFEEVYGIKIT
jgi:hypothetical protein